MAREGRRNFRWGHDQSPQREDSHQGTALRYRLPGEEAGLLDPGEAGHFGPGLRESRGRGDRGHGSVRQDGRHRKARRWAEPQREDHPRWIRLGLPHVLQETRLPGVEAGGRRVQGDARRPVDGQKPHAAVGMEGSAEENRMKSLNGFRM